MVGLFTGREGLPPEPLYDPLAFWIDEAHARGLQLHAWFNPYRAAHPSRPGPPSEGSVLVTRPEMCVTLGDGGYRWLDPARADVQRHSLAVILDVVRRYDVDGVHFDDYFYPYPSYADGAGFPDEETWRAYRQAGGRLGRADWRRRAVDRFVQDVAREVHRVDPHVLFSVSPFGIWRPGEPRGSRASTPTRSSTRTRGSGCARAGSTPWFRSSTGPSAGWPSPSPCCSDGGSARTRSGATCGPGRPSRAWKARRERPSS